MTARPELERLLADAAAHLEFPETPDLAGQVEVRLTASPPRRPATPASHWWWRAAAVTAAAVIASVVVLAIPTAREAVADFLGIGRARVELVPTLPPTVVPLGSGLDLGTPVTLAEAGERGGGPVGLPTRLGAPESVYVDGDGRVTLVYAPGPGLAAPAGSSVGLLLERVPADTGGFTKEVTADTAVSFERVKGDLAIWLEGGPHLVTYADPAGERRARPGRLAGNTLLWADRGFTYRLEADVPLAEAVAIAESIP